jgi:hypothetical protein
MAHFVDSNAQTTLTLGQDNLNSSYFLDQPTITNFDNLNDDELNVMVSLASRTLRDRQALSTTTNLSPKALNNLNIAKFEQIAYAGLKPKYNGPLYEPTLNAVHKITSK